MELSPRLLPVCLALGVVSISEVVRAAPDTVVAPEPAPSGIHGGEPNGPCAWPTAVAVTGGNSLCTGTLVHPRVVLFAAHCGGGSKTILFGEDMTSPKKTVKPDLCMVYPSYAGVNDQEHDWAFCRLAEPITDLPVTPVVYGCETEIVFPGQTAGVTGFGITTQGGNSGIKNWGMTPIHSVGSGSADVGGGNQPGICPGDSGGPAYVRYPDGSWHTFGIASTLTGQCGGQGTHSLTWNAVPWVEEESGIDITPCHDLDGTWNPTHKCGNFYAGEPGVGVGDWLQWCPGTPKTGSSATCGKAFDAVPDNTPPTVSITTPVSADYPDQTSLTTPIEVNADDGDGWGVAVVRIKINGQLQPLTDEEPPYAFATVKFPKGSYELVAIAEDAAGLVTESLPVTINIGVVPSDPTTGDETGSASTDVPTTDAETGVDTSGNPSGVTSMTGAETADTADTAPMDGGDDGCGCRSQPRAPASLGLLLLLGLCRRRRASARARARTS